MQEVVKLEDIPIDNIIPNVPNSSLVIIDEGKISIFLYADGFRGVNGQVGKMEIENILIRDNRKYGSRLKGKLDEYLKSLKGGSSSKEIVKNVLGYFIKYLDKEN